MQSSSQRIGVAAVAILVSFVLLIHSNSMISPDRRLQDKLDQGISESEKIPLRGLFFGTSRTWGVGMESKMNLVYPWQVCTNVTNLAIRATGPQFPAMVSELSQSSNFWYA